MKSALALFLILTSSTVFAQSSDVAYIYMTYGPGIEVGTIEENEPGSHIILRTPMGQLKRINYSEIDSITYKEDVEGVPSVSTGHSPFLAGALSALLPGAGQVYNGEYGKALLYPLSMIGIAAVAGIFVLGAEISAWNGSSMSVGGIIFTVVGAAGILTMYVLGIIDAAESASHFQKMQQFMAAGTPRLKETSPLLASAGSQSVTVQIPLPF